MRKHNVKFCTRFGRKQGDGSTDRTNFPQRMAHSLTNDKGFQLGANSLLRSLFKRAGVAA